MLDLRFSIFDITSRILISDAIKPVIVESNQHSVTGAMYVCLKITKAQPYRTLKGSCGVFRRGFAITSMRKSQYSIMLKKSVACHL